MRGRAGCVLRAGPVVLTAGGRRAGSGICARSTGRLTSCWGQALVGERWRTPVAAARRRALAARYRQLGRAERTARCRRRLSAAAAPAGRSSSAVRSCSCMSACTASEVWGIKGEAFRSRSEAGEPPGSAAVCINGSVGMVGSRIEVVKRFVPPAGRSDASGVIPVAQDETAGPLFPPTRQPSIRPGTGSWDKHTAFECVPQETLVGCGSSPPGRRRRTGGMRKAWLRRS